MITLITEYDNVDQYQPGEASVFSRNDGTKGLILKCPQCGLVHACSDKTNFNEETLSLSASTICQCGFHRTLTNGEWHK